MKKLNGHSTAQLVTRLLNDIDSYQGHRIWNQTEMYSNSGPSFYWFIWFRQVSSWVKSEPKLRFCNSKSYDTQHQSTKEGMGNIHTFLHPYFNLSNETFHHYGHISTLYDYYRVWKHLKEVTRSYEPLVMFHGVGFLFIYNKYVCCLLDKAVWGSLQQNSLLWTGQGMSWAPSSEGPVWARSRQSWEGRLAQAWG